MQLRGRFAGNRRGQFIIIAALLIAIMIVSAGAVIFNTATYFRHERWEEYLIVIDGVKGGTNNLLALSLANYTQTSNGNVLKANIDAWRLDVGRAYSGYGAILSCGLASGARSAYGMSLTYAQGLASTWNQRVSFSAANATGSLNITSVGLNGYQFVSTVFLKLNITDVLWYNGQGQNPGQVGVRVVMYAEGPTLLTSLQMSNFVLFQVGGVNQSFSLVRYYESSEHSGEPALNTFVYELRYSSQNDPGTVTATVGVVDSRGIRVVGQATVSTTDA